MNALTALKEGQRYTVVKMGDMGFCFSVQFELVEKRIEPWAQYAESVLLIFKQKGKRNLRQIRFINRDDFLVYEGWVEANTEMFVEEDKSGPFTVKKSLLSCDIEYLLRAKRSVTKAPLIEQISEDALKRYNRQL
jgi:hypothetical protein